jgi:hypothetical protein
MARRSHREPVDIAVHGRHLSAAPTRRPTGERHVVGTIDRRAASAGRGRRAIEVLALVFVALSVAPPVAHLASLPNKIGVAKDAYFVMQRAYDGWWVLGLAWFAALCLSALAAFVNHRDRRTRWLWVGAAAAMLVTFLIFLVWTAPANRATANWTTAPADWSDLRRQWEISHAVSAATTLAALCAAALAVVRPTRDRMR